MPPDPPPSASSQSPRAPGAALRKLAAGFAFTEGPASDAAGNVYFTDQPNDRILRWGVDGTLSTVMHPCGRSNGLCFDGAGRLIACADEHNQLWRIDLSTDPLRHAVLVRDFGGKLLNGPNDVWVHPDGGMYFTDPLYPRDYWSRSPQQQQDARGVYHLSADGGTLRRVAAELTQPNGIIGTPDGRTLYVADIDAKQTWAYAVAADGSLAGKRLFCPMGSDGMTIDDAGNVYLTGDGVTVFDRGGQQVDHIPVPEGWTGNVCFGGPDRRTLFVTASTGLYAMEMRVRGVGSQ